MVSSVKPIALCKRTGEYVYPTDVDGYYGVCPATDENLYQVETIPLAERTLKIFSPGIDTIKSF